MYPVDGVVLINNKLGSCIIKCHGQKEIFICFSGNRTWIAGFVGGQSPSVLASPGNYSRLFDINKYYLTFLTLFNFQKAIPFAYETNWLA